jgi:hypothetical protein
MAEQLASRGDQVFAACLGDGDWQKKNVAVLPGVDVTCDTAVSKMTPRWPRTKLR